MDINLSNKTLRKILLIGFVVLVYVYTIRPARNILFSFQYNSTVSEQTLKEQKIEVITLEERAVIFGYGENQAAKRWHYTIPFGIYFVLSLALLIMPGGKRKLILILVIIHFIAMAAASLLLWTGMNWHPNWLMGLDLMARYLIPFGSFGLIPLAYIQQKNTNEGNA
ncbi:MAG: hypothetical protein FH748_16740 [Balneolaceae bacterium]|nr:hypothetical protein [Balneolaceae bacterium]